MNHDDSILWQQTGSIGTLTFNRPGVYNAMNREMILMFRDTLRRIPSQPGLRVLILRGAGKAFISGGDVALFHKEIATVPTSVKALGDALHEGIVALREAPFPVIAAVNGPAAGAGVSVALACDIAIAAENASFNTAYSKIGASPDGGSTWFLPRAIGARKALELILLADTLTAGDALSLGLVNRVVPAERLNAEVAALAERLAAGPTQAYARAKRLISQSFHTPIRAHLDDEIECFRQCTLTADFAEGVAAFVERRPARFSGAEPTPTVTPAVRR